MPLFHLSRFLITSCVGFIVVLVSAKTVSAYEIQLRSEARYLSGQIAEQGRTSTAVIDFTDLDGAVTHLGRFMAEELSVELAAGAHSFQVVDRNHIRSLLKEHKLSSSGLIDPETARELGRIAGVDTLLTGTITPLGDSMRLSIKVIDSGTAQVVASSSCSIAKTLAIDSLLRRGVAVQAPLGNSPAIGTETSSTVEQRGILFTLQGCIRSGQTVTCHVLLTSEKDQKVYMRDKTRAIDPFGNEIYASRIQLGNNRTRIGQASGSLVRGVPIKANVVFEGIALEIRRLTLIEFNFSFTAQFRDVPIS